MKRKIIGKLVLSTILVLGLAFITTSPTQAKSVDSVSEYESIKKELDDSIEKAFTSSVNKQQFVQAYEYASNKVNVLKEHIVSMNNHSNENLIALGYNEDQISAIRNLIILMK